jgi:hypothetical protein
MVSAMGYPVTPWLTIGCGTVNYNTQADAEAVLAGYAFGTAPLVWTAPSSCGGDKRLAAAPRAVRQSKWGYRTYDCAPNSPYAFGVNDLLLVAALDARVAGSTYLAMEAILPDLNAVLAEVDISQTFWTLPCNYLGAVTPPPNTPAWLLWRAWVLLEGLNHIGTAITYKTLHHKRPWLFPIFDNATVRVMGRCGSPWQTLHRELTTQPNQFEHLEKWFAIQAIKRGGAYLTRLRIHDILLWGEITGERGSLDRAGRPFLDE